MLVVDANVVVEVTLERFGVTALDALGDEQLTAPWLLWSEVPAALSAMVFRTEISRELGESALGRLETIKVEPLHPAGLVTEAWRITKERGWAKTYDAEYLALAQPARLPPCDARRTAVARHQKSRLRRDAGGAQAPDRGGLDSTRSTGARGRSHRIWVVRSARDETSA